MVGSITAPRLLRCKSPDDHFFSLLLHILVITHLECHCVVHQFAFHYSGFNSNFHFLPNTPLECQWVEMSLPFHRSTIWSLAASFGVQLSSNKLRKAIKDGLNTWYLPPMCGSWDGTSGS